MLKENGIAPSPDRPSSWKAFLKAHWGQVVGADFFSTEVWTRSGLRTAYTLFVIDLKTRVVHIPGSTRNPDEPWMVRAAKNLTDCFDGFLLGKRAFICDRDTKFSERFRAILEQAGVRVVRTPARAPNCNAHAERFVQSIKRECLSRMVFFGEDSLRKAIDEYVVHYDADRPHQGVGNQPLSDRPPPNMAAEVEVHERLGGLLKSYRRAA